MSTNINELVEEFLKEVRISPPPALIVNLRKIDLESRSVDGRFMHPKILTQLEIDAKKTGEMIK